jgi:hypothetical protein
MLWWDVIGMRLGSAQEELRGRIFARPEWAKGDEDGYAKIHFADRFDTNVFHTYDLKKDTNGWIVRGSISGGKVHLFP